jgi:hypothetical protein
MVRPEEAVFPFLFGDGTALSCCSPVKKQRKTALTKGTQLSRVSGTSLYSATRSTARLPHGAFQKRGEAEDCKHIQACLHQLDDKQLYTNRNRVAPDSTKKISPKLLSVHIYHIDPLAAAKATE